MSDLKVNIPPEVGKGKFANIVSIMSNQAEFIIDFIRNLPASPPEMVSRIILSPVQAKAFLGALQTNIASFETQNGKINVITQEKPQETQTYTLKIPSDGIKN